MGDWDLSRLEDGLLVIGGLDGAVSGHGGQVDYLV